jgi:hypothetical protein
MARIIEVEVRNRYTVVYRGYRDDVLPSNLDGLDTVHAGAIIRPQGCQGWWWLSAATEDRPMRLVRFSGSGRRVYSMPMAQPGLYRAGQKFGHRVVEPQEEGDPFKRVFRELGIPLRGAFRDPVLLPPGQEFHPTWGPYAEAYWTTDGVVRGSQWEREVVGATFFIYWRAPRYLEGVALWENADPEKFRMAILRDLEGPVD